MANQMHGLENDAKRSVVGRTSAMRQESSDVPSSPALSMSVSGG